MSKKVLIIGSLGYVGSYLYKKLKNNYEIEGIDNHFFANSFLIDDNLNNEIIKKDVRDLDESYLIKFQVVILLAGISNDPLIGTDEDLFYKPPLKYSIKVADICKSNGIKLIFSSSCSVYGYNKNVVNESSETNPLTGYSKNKLEIENYITSIADNNFKPIILRFATIYGLSPRMRFDVVINMLVGMAIIKNEVILNSNGQASRPHLHIDDAANVIQNSIEFDEYSKYLLVNVGQNIDNKKIIDAAKIITDYYKCNLNFLNRLNQKKNYLFSDKKIVDNIDKRSYVVNFDKFKKTFKNFSFNWNLKEGIISLIDNLESMRLNEKSFYENDFYRVKKLEYLYNNKIINNELVYIKN